MHRLWPLICIQLAMRLWQVTPLILVSESYIMRILITGHTSKSFLMKCHMYVLYSQYILAITIVKA